MLNLRSAGVVQEDARVIWRTICFGRATNWMYRKIFLENVRIAVERGLLHLLEQKNYLWIFQRRRSGPGGRCTWFWMILQHGNRRLWAAAMPEHRGPKRRWSAQRFRSKGKVGEIFRNFNVTWDPSRHGLADFSPGVLTAISPQFQTSSSLPGSSQP